MNKSLLIYIGTWADGQRLAKAQHYQRKTAPTLSGNNYSLALSKEFPCIFDETINISILPGNSFPKNKKMFIKDSFWDGQNLSISFWNGLLLRNYSIKKSLKRAYKKHLRTILKEKNDRYDIFIYCNDPRSSLVWFAVYLKTKINNSKLLLDFPDLPHLTNRITSNFIFKYLKNIDAQKTYKLANTYADAFLFFSPLMDKYFDIQNRPIINSPGIVELNLSNNDNIAVPPVICFSGSTDEESSNMHLLIESVVELSKRKPIKLKIIGSGGNEKYLQDCSNKYEFIDYLGRLLPDEVKKQQANSSVLISLRPTLQKFDLACPSKILEYLGTGHPVVAFKINSLPLELDDLIIHPSEDTKDAVVEAIEKALESSSDITACRYDLIKKYTAPYLAKQIKGVFYKL